MSLSQGVYHRLEIYQERKRRQAMLLQRSTDGTPVYVESADVPESSIW